MRNWLGQELAAGKLVYRGARDGDSSSFRVGQIMQVNNETRKVRVKWLHDQGVDWKNRGQKHHIETPIAVKPRTKESTVDGETLVLIDPGVQDTVRLTKERQYELLKGLEA